MNWKKNRKIRRICIDITGTQLAQFLKQYKKGKYDSKTIKLMEKMMLRLLDTYLTILELEEIGRTQKSTPWREVNEHI